MSRSRCVALVVVGVLALSVACGGDEGAAPEEPQSVVRAFVDAVNEDDNARAGALLAEGAVLYGATVPPGRGEQAAAQLECRAEIESIEQSGETVTVALRFSERESTPGLCRAGEEPIPTRFVVRDGKITEIAD